MNWLIHRLVVLFSLSFAPLFGQHDAQRDAVQAIARGDVEKFEKAFLNPKVDAGGEETAFVGILNLLSQDDLAGAFALTRKALERGFDPARLLAGSDPLLVALRGHPDFSNLPGIAEVGPIIHGPMVGHVGTNEASIWVRTNGEQEVRIELDRGCAVVSSAVTTSAELDFTATLVVDNLEPDTEYSGKVISRIGESEAFTFKTRPARGSSAKFSIAFGGGAGYVPEYERMWSTIRTFQPDALLLLGDNVYIDDPDHSLTQDYCYHRRQSRPEWRSLIATVPVYTIYDDHDFAWNDAVPGPEIDDPSWKRPVWERFRMNWANPRYGGGDENPGCWYDFSIGDVQFFMLDGRYYRDLEGGSMLGPIQKQWFLEALSASTATFKVVVSPVPFSPKIKPGSRDPWDGFPEEREEIFAAIEQEAIEGVFLVSADRHRTDLRRIERAESYDLVEFESSKLTNRHVHPVVEGAGLIWGYNETCSFGLIDFDTTLEIPEVTFRCIDIDGEKQERFVLSLEDLSH